jgi:hypothetical protein
MANGTKKLSKFFPPKNNNVFIISKNEDDGESFNRFYIFLYLEEEREQVRTS